MNADEDGIATSLRSQSRPAMAQDIAVPGRDDTVTASGGKGFEALRYVQRHLLFRDSLTGNTAINRRDPHRLRQ